MKHSLVFAEVLTTEIDHAILEQDVMALRDQLNRIHRKIRMFENYPETPSTYQPINLSTHQPINPSTYKPINL